MGTTFFFLKDGTNGSLKNEGELSMFTHFPPRPPPPPRWGPISLVHPNLSTGFSGLIEHQK